ncbi:exodeoxyribonuclease VII large subunit [Niameybacter massiliensis]|uniref:Exodeoxyribonuclease 7 large subunit n=1 Tax=Holtiella tumoricola TaxID=3018743 RepID=A0AA42DRJ9_9FIRM|nr:exodeoxyribonuclease VII large subunit [Holtiella tumoricola]MDA3733766.1 exodeoxyribonuclease VII large subunit [Holtiella tumoricola]
MKRKIVAVSEINRYVSRLLEEDYLLSDVWLSGEVSNCKYHQSGHIYFTIKDPFGSLNAVMFAKDAATLDFILKEGLKVYVRGRIALYEKTGQFQCYVWEIEKQGQGTLYEQFERLKGKLSDEGLFDPHYKKAIPTYPSKVGIITSATGAAIQDILNVAKRRNNAIPLYIYPTHVQGEYATLELIAAIERANKEKLVDVLIVGRGGGSIEDLWCFNDERLARCIFASEIPIVSAVGHEIDFTISDFVSDLRAPTPSAAAELVIPDKEAYLMKLERSRSLLKHHVEKHLQDEKIRLERLLSRPVYKNKEKYFADLRITLDYKVEALTKGFEKKLATYNTTLNTRIGQLEKLSPLLTLKRGYSFTTTENGKVLTSIEQVEIGNAIHVEVTDGVLYAKVEKKG